MSMLEYPSVTIIMPIRNEADFIQRSLGAVLAQDYPQECLQILVADGMSDDGTRAIVSVLAAKHNNIRLLDNPRQIVPTAFNCALEEAQSAIIIRVDGHCEIAPDYVQRCVELLSEMNADNVGGPMNAVSEGTVAEAIALATSSPFGVGGARFHYATEPGWVDTVYLGAYRREVFDRIGRFDEELIRNQDDEFNFRLTQAGGKIWLDPSIRAIYYSRATLSGLWKQYYQYGLYKVRVIQKRQAIPSWRHLVPGLFVLSLIFSFILTIFTRKSTFALTVVAPYTIANLGASLWIGRRRPALLPFLPLAFATLHLAYGFGFLAGLWKWRDKWAEEAGK